MSDMDCEYIRESLSACQDGESPAVSDHTVETHLLSCPACRSFAQDIPALSRAIKVRRAEVSPDLTPTILRAIGEREASLPHEEREYDHGRTRRAWALRLSLALAGLMQLSLTLPQLLFGMDAMGAPYHVAQELGSLDVALGAGFLFAALRPRLSGGLAAMALVAAACLVVTAELDVWNHTTTLFHEAYHLPAVIGSLLLYMLARAFPLARAPRMSVMRSR